MVRPVDNKWPITQNFGANAHWSWQLGYGHLGEDFGCPIGTDVYAIQNGVTLFADWGIKMSRSFAAQYAFIFGSPDSGIVHVAKYDDGTVGIAAHLNETKMNAGQRFVGGQVIGKTGTTGRSTGPHLHQECMRTDLMSNGRYGRINPSTYWNRFDKAPALLATQRVVLSGGVNEFDAPTTKGRVLRTFKGGDILNFKGYVLGERVNGQNGWLVGTSGKYFHIGRFTQKNVNGLKNLTPAPAPKPSILPQSLKTIGSVVKARKNPYLKSNNLAVEIRPSSTVVCSAYTDAGDSVNGSRVWYKTAVSGYWIHSSLFTTQPTAKLKKIAPPTR